MPADGPWRPRRLMPERSPRCGDAAMADWVAVGLRVPFVRGHGAMTASPTDAVGSGCFLLLSSSLGSLFFFFFFSLLSDVIAVLPFFPPQRNHLRRKNETSASLQARDAARALKWKRRSEMAAERAALREAAGKH